MALLGQKNDSLDCAGLYHSSAYGDYLTRGPPKAFLTLSSLGFCGVDDSVDPEELIAISRTHPKVEWGVLFRPELAGKPRYASSDWLNRLSRVNARREMQLAAHLCGSRVMELLNGDFQFVHKLFSAYGFRRVQVNATSVNGVKTDSLHQQWPKLRHAATQLPDIEFIIQRNEETKPLWQPLLEWCETEGIHNMSFLFDSSCGLGVLGKSWPAPPSSLHVKFGYAGGLGPSNVAEQLLAMSQAAPGRTLWIDMESSLRTESKKRVAGSATGKDIFDLSKVLKCIESCASLGLIN